MKLLVSGTIFGRYFISFAILLFKFLEESKKVKMYFIEAFQFVN